VDRAALGAADRDESGAAGKDDRVIYLKDRAVSPRKAG
jgi:hypothetical protein